MTTEFYQLPEAHQQILDDTPEPLKVHVILLDWDDLPLARGTATLPLFLGVGVFWPSCPMPDAGRLAKAKCFVLPTGEMLKLKSMALCGGNPPRYDFWVNPPWMPGFHSNSRKSLKSVGCSSVGLRHALVTH